jgi:hypothetical protein
MMAFGVSGGGGAVVALSARTIPGLKVVVNVSGGFALLNCDKNSDRLVEAMRYYGARSRVPNLWHYAKTDSIFSPSLRTDRHRKESSRQMRSSSSSDRV